MLTAVCRKQVAELGSPRSEGIAASSQAGAELSCLVCPRFLPSSQPPTANEAFMMAFYGLSVPKKNYLKFIG